MSPTKQLPSMHHSPAALAASTSLLRLVGWKPPPPMPPPPAAVWLGRRAHTSFLSGSTKHATFPKRKTRFPSC